MTMSDELRAQQAQARVSEQMAAMLTRLASMAKTQRSTGLIVPVVDADPDADDPANIWLFADGRMRYRTPDGVVHELDESHAQYPLVPTLSSDPAVSTGIRIWLHGGTLELRVRAGDNSVVRFAPIAGGTSSDGGSAPTKPSGGSSTVPKPVDTAPKRYRKVYSPTWGRAFCSSHGVETGSALYYGYYPGAHGERRIMFGFDEAAIASDLAGATIRQVEIKLRNVNSWAYSGVDIHFGAHAKSSAPSAFSAVRKDAYVGHWPQSGYGGGSDDYHELSSTWIARAFQNGSIKGLTIDQPSSQAAYGQCDWDSLRLAITYTK